MTWDERSGWEAGGDAVAGVILGIVLERHPGLVAREELVRELGAPLTQRVGEAQVADGLTDLAASGLIHRLDGFVLASRAATRAAELLEA